MSGHHVDIRLTADDGYHAQRSYSIASPPEDELLALTVERVDNGEVSPYLVGDLRVGDQFELRGANRRLFRLDGRSGEKIRNSKIAQKVISAHARCNIALFGVPQKWGRHNLADNKPR
jgi:hypothetical protein